MLNVIGRAIREHLVVNFMYVNEDGGTSYVSVQPYTLGQTSKNNTAIRGFDTSVSKFKLYLLSSMSSLKVTSKQFTPKFAIYGDKGLHDIQYRIILNKPVKGGLLNKISKLKMR